MGQIVDMVSVNKVRSLGVLSTWADVGFVPIRKGE